MRVSRGGDRRYAPNPLKNIKDIGFLSQTSPDKLAREYHTAAKPAFNVGLSMAY